LSGEGTDRRRIRCADLGGDQQRVERAVADEDEAPARVGREVAAAVAGEGARRTEQLGQRETGRSGSDPAQEVGAIGHAAPCSRRILPTTPSRSPMSSNASSKRPAGKRRAMMGGRSTSPTPSSSTTRDQIAVV